MQIFCNRHIEQVYRNFPIMIKFCDGLSSNYILSNLFLYLSKWSWQRGLKLHDHSRAWFSLLQFFMIGNSIQYPLMLEIYYPKKNVVNCNENENRLCFTKMCLSSKLSVSSSHPIFQEIHITIKTTKLTIWWYEDI